MQPVKDKMLVAGELAGSPILSGSGKERDDLTREALADVDAGEVIDHQAVAAWVACLGDLEAVALDEIEGNQVSEPDVRNVKTRPNH